MRKIYIVTQINLELLFLEKLSELVEILPTIQDAIDEIKCLNRELQQNTTIQNVCFDEMLFKVNLDLFFK